MGKSMLTVFHHIRSECVTKLANLLLLSVQAGKSPQDQSNNFQPHHYSFGHAGQFYGLPNGLDEL